MSLNLKIVLGAVLAALIGAWLGPVALHAIGDRLMGAAALGASAFFAGMWAKRYLE